MTNKQINFIALFFLILGIFVRFYHLDFQSVWFDELFYILAASKSSLKELLDIHFVDTNPPLLTIIYFYWIKIFGDSVYSLRFTSAMVGSINLILIYYYVLRPKFFRKEVYFYILIIFSTCLGGVYFSQELRSYALMMLLSFIYLHTFSGIILNILEHKEGSKNDFIILAITSIFISYLHYFGFIYAGLGLFIIFVFAITQKNTRIVLMSILSGVLFLLFFSFEIFKLLSLKGGSINWIPQPNLLIYLEFLNFIFYFLKGKYFIYFIILFLVLYTYSFLSKKILKTTRTERTLILFYLLFSLVVLSFTFFVSLYKPIVTARNLLVLIFPILFIFSYLINRIVLPNKYLMNFIIILFSLYMFYQYYSDYSKPHKTDFKSLAIVSAEKEYSDFILYSFDKVDFYNFYGQKYNKEKKVIMLPEISKQNLTLLPNKFILLEAGLLGKLADDQIHILKDQYKMKNISFYGSEMKIFTRE